MDYKKLKQSIILLSISVLMLIIAAVMFYVKGRWISALGIVVIIFFMCIRNYFKFREAQKLLDTMGDEQREKSSDKAHELSKGNKRMKVSRVLNSSD